MEFVSIPRPTQATAVDVAGFALLASNVLEESAAAAAAAVQARDRARSRRLS